ncbi:hypothetical protein [Leptolyngbya sp. FACHB-16]|uniref:hypothetical protein n=1 Tax=unclassified Leptolyngbya TaxID=2650499 RepID=UPI001684569D|nr:hypothetical protein [Leptolyngbya sp. FACHB-16]MBD2152917.1 hypothetical protein [Leptolyngbya sp. FACHB-16]
MTNLDFLASATAVKFGYRLVIGVLEDGTGYSLINIETKNRTDYRTLDSVFEYLQTRYERSTLLLS